MVLAFPVVLTHGRFMRLPVWSMAASFYDPSLSLWMRIIFFLLYLRTDIARCLDLYRKRHFRVLLSFQACLAYVHDLRLNGDIRLLLDLHTTLARDFDWGAHLNFGLPVDVDARLAHSLTNNSRTLAQ